LAADLISRLEKQKIIKIVLILVMVLENHVQRNLLTALIEVVILKKTTADRHVTFQKLDHLHLDCQLRKIVIQHAKPGHIGITLKIQLINIVGFQGVILNVSSNKEKREFVQNFM